jgi:hypothetical protein
MLLKLREDVRAESSVESDECLGPSAELGRGSVDFVRRGHLDNLKVNPEGRGGALKRSKVSVAWPGIPQNDGA